MRMDISLLTLLTSAVTDSKFKFGFMAASAKAVIIFSLPFSYS